MSSTGVVQETVSKKRKRGQHGKQMRRLNVIEKLPFKREVDEKLLSGESPTKVSEWLKVEKGVDVGPHGVRNYLRKVIGPMRAFRGIYYKKMLIGLDTDVDALLELKRLAQVQMKRLSLGLQYEETKNTMISQVDKGLDVLRGVLNDILEKEMDLGIRERKSAGEPGQGITDDQLRELLEEVMRQNRKEPQVEPNPTAQ